MARMRVHGATTLCGARACGFGAGHRGGECAVTIATPQVRVRIRGTAVRRHADLCEDPDGAWRAHVRGRAARVV